MKGFKSFMLRGEIVVIAVGLIVALAFSTLIEAFTTNVILPLITRAQGSESVGLGVQLGKKGYVPTFLNIGGFVSAVIYFIIFMAVIYFAIVVPYKKFQARKGVAVFADPAPTKVCPACLSGTLPIAATKCKFCASDLAPVTPPAPAS